MNPADLARLGWPELETLAGHARAIAQAESAAHPLGGIVAATVAGASPIEAWRHYPAGDVYDARSHAQFFYHAHPPAERGAEEHGHFHAFLRAGGMPAGVRPLVLPELAIAGSPGAPAAPSAPAAEDGDAWCHLIAVTMDEAGRPLRLFTTNRWVTGETWYRHEDVLLMLDRFAFDAAGPAPVVNEWLAALVGFYRPQIAALLKARDEAVMGWRRRRRGKVHVFDDRRLEIASSLEISLGADMSAVEDARARAARRAS